MGCKETVGVGDLYCTLAKRLGVLASPLTIQHSFKTFGEILCSVTMQSM
jgi:hypothetical protein